MKSTAPASHPACAAKHPRDEVCSSNGQLRNHDVNKLLETTARTKVARYREAYANRQGMSAIFPTAPCSRVRARGGRLGAWRPQDSSR